MHDTIGLTGAMALLVSALAGVVTLATPIIVKILQAYADRLQRLEAIARDNQNAISHLQNGGGTAKVLSVMKEYGVPINPGDGGSTDGGRRAGDTPPQDAHTTNNPTGN